MEEEYTLDDPTTLLRDAADFAHHPGIPHILLLPSFDFLTIFVFLQFNLLFFSFLLFIVQEFTVTLQRRRFLTDSLFQSSSSKFSVWFPGNLEETKENDKILIFRSFHIRFAEHRGNLFLLICAELEMLLVLFSWSKV